MTAVRRIDRPFRPFGPMAGMLALYVLAANAAHVFAAAPSAGLDPTKLAALAVEPADIVLDDARDTQQLLITGRQTDDSLIDLTRAVKFESLNPAVAAVDERGLVRPIAKGETQIRATALGRTVETKVVVKDADPNKPVSFLNEVMPVLSKAGCNSGACHGAASGKYGFKISLRGYDPAFDYRVLTRDSLGRRLNKLDPEQSLVLLKPTAQIAHEGGRRFPKGSLYYDLLRRWIAEGNASDAATAPKLQAIEVLPSYRVYNQPGAEQQLLVLATYSDGTRRDVTREARYSSSNENAAEIAESRADRSTEGLVRLVRRGEAAVTARFGDKVAVSRLVILAPAPGFVWSNPPANNYIDELVFAKLRDVKILPSELSSDTEFLRRVSLDLIGLQPTPADVRAFLADSRPDKRRLKIDELLSRGEFTDFWTLKWADLLKLKFDALRDKGVWGYYRWIRASVAENKPFDQFVRELVAASGATDANPAANYYRVFATPEELGENTVQVFFGIRLMCAKCHDHPFEKWTQRDYYGMAAFFSQVARKGTPNRRQNAAVILTNDAAPRSTHPTTGETLIPKFLDGAAIDVPAGQDARRRLADWATSRDNPFFARATVNRIWSFLFGRGIIDPVDDIRTSNPPSNEKLLDALAKDFVAHGYDVKHLVRTIAGSRTYQLSSTPSASNADDVENFSHAPVRRLTAEQLVDAVSQATGVPEQFAAIQGRESVVLPVSLKRAAEIPDGQISSYLLAIFGRPQRESTCSCERRQEATMTQALHLLNGASLGQRLSDPNGREAKLVKEITDDRKLVDELCLWAVCRLPTDREREIGLAHLKREGRDKGAQDLFWALLNTREFLFNY